MDGALKYWHASLCRVKGGLILVVGLAESIMYYVQLQLTVILVVEPVEPVEAVYYVHVQCVQLCLIGLGYWVD